MSLFKYAVSGTVFGVNYYYVFLLLLELGAFSVIVGVVHSQ